MRFSELLGEPEPESEVPATDAEPIGVFAPVPAPSPPETTSMQSEPTPPPLPTATPAAPAPVTPVAPVTVGARSGLAELNVRPEIPVAAAVESTVADQLVGLETVVDDLLPSSRHRSRK